jgi:photosystem II stability/assembly factor-like uncharacterized protein
MTEKQTNGRWHIANGHWERMSPVAAGGAVSSLGMLIAPDSTVVWAATNCGIFRRQNSGAWQQSLHGLTTPQISSIHVASAGALLAGGINAELFHSSDGGATWRQAALSGVSNSAPVTCIASSPGYAHDAVALAGTDGAGILRTEDGGKTWSPSNFGLPDLSVLALVCAPDWSTAEVALAGTAEGLFRSTNGGRAWREVQHPLSDAGICALAAVPGVDRPGVFYAATEESGLYASSDAGRRWTELAAPSGDSPINALYVVPGTEGRVVVAGTGDGIFRSENGGEKWSLVLLDASAVLSLAGGNQLVVAGSQDRGVWHSRDGGRSWEVAEGFAARGLAKIVASGRSLFALGPDEGVWRSVDHGRSWQALSTLEVHLPLICFAAAARPDNGEVLFASSNESGLLRSSSGETWQTVWSGAPIRALLVAPGGSTDNRAWAITAAGDVLFSQDLGTTWSTLSSDLREEQALLIAASPHLSRDQTLLIGAVSREGWQRQPAIHVWRSTDGGRVWKKVLDHHTRATWLDAVLPPAAGRRPYDGAIFVTGTQCLRPLESGQDVWVGAQVAPDGVNALCLAMAGDVSREGTLYAGTWNGIFYSQDGGRRWVPCGSGIDGGCYISIALGADDDGRPALYALQLGSVVWRGLPSYL